MFLEMIKMMSFAMEVFVSLIRAVLSLRDFVSYPWGGWRGSMYETAGWRTTPSSNCLYDCTCDILMFFIIEKLGI